MKYYFTYGSEGQPYSGGWTEVDAENRHQATEAFKAFHPLKDGFLTCCGTYNEEDFRKTGMADGNFGHGCWERISLTREILQ